MTASPPMQIVEFAGSTLRFLETVPDKLPPDGFIWIYLERDALRDQLATLQRAALVLGGSVLLDLHLQDLENRSHPSYYDSTSVYDQVVFRRLATSEEVEQELRTQGEAVDPASPLQAFQRIRTRAVGFVAFDRLLISVHPDGCYMARSFIGRYLSDAVQSEGVAGAIRNRLPNSPADLMLRMINLMVDSYLELRKLLSAEMAAWQRELLRPASKQANWNSLLIARSELHKLEDLCEEQNDAMQEWLDTARELPAAMLAQSDRDGLLARARDVIEHIQRVVHHIRQMEHGAESAVQIHFSAQSHQTNEIMRLLTAVTAVFMPLNLITGFFGMNFEFLPLIHSRYAMWVVLTMMLWVGLIVLLIFWRKRFLARSGR